MTLEHFLEKHNIKLSRNILKLCNDGMELLSKSIDLGHDTRHVELMLDDLDSYLANVKVSTKLKFDRLLPSIVFHDVWKSQIDTTKNLKTFLFAWFYEGYGSSKIFKRFAEKNDVTQEDAKMISTAISRHVKTGFSIIDYLTRPKNLEEKILYDLDNLSILHKERFTRLVDDYFEKNKKVNPLRVYLVALYLKIVVTRRMNDFKISYFKTKNKAYFKVIMQEVITLYRELYENPSKYLTKHKNYKRYLRYDPADLTKQYLSAHS